MMAVRLSPKNSSKDIDMPEWIPDYVGLVKNHLEKSETSLIGQVREDLAWAAHTRDSNTNVHTLLRLMRRSERDRITGRIGSAMKFLEMAESIRRASEQLLNIKLPEEDELGPGQWMDGARKSLYGAERVFDASRKDLRDFLGVMGLDFGIKVRCYVEGETELGALRHAVGANGLCSFVNLKGNVVQRHGRGMAFSDSLKEDGTSRIISVVMVDSDREEVVRILRRSASEQCMHGPFFLNIPDFELANFTVEELLRVATSFQKELRWDDSEVDEQVSTTLLKVANVKSAKEFLSLIKQDGFDNVCKGERWGEALMKYAIAHPTFGPDSSKEGTEREIVKAANLLIRAQDVGYLRSLEHEEVDPNTGQMVARKK